MYKLLFSEQKYAKLLNDLPLTQFEKDVLGARYLSILEKTVIEYKYNHVMFVILTNIVSIAGILVTSLLLLEQIPDLGPTSATGLFWTTWALALLLTLANKWLNTFDVYKKYILNKIVLEKLKSEGWQFITGIGRYRCSILADRFELFCARIEHIHLKSIENMPEMEMNDAAADILATGSQKPTEDTNSTINVEKIHSRRSKSARQTAVKDIVIDILDFVNIDVSRDAKDYNDDSSKDDNIVSADEFHPEISRNEEIQIIDNKAQHEDEL